MCAQTSTASPISASISRADMHPLEPTGGSFEGAEGILRAWRRGIKPDPHLTVSEWSDEHRWLSGISASEPGRWRTSRTPYLRGVMDALSPSDPATRISFMKGAQVGATEAGNNWIGFVIHHAPGPMLAVMPDLEVAKRNSRQRLEPLIRSSPVLSELIPEGARRGSGNTLLSKEFPGGILVMVGAQSAASLRSMPARYVFMDEVDGYPASTDEEGDPVTLAEARTVTFGHRRKVFLVSTPTTRGLSRIEREFERSDQRRFFVPCPFCDHMQWLQWERLRWEKGHPDGAAYHCESCEEPIPEYHKTQMLAAGKWIATATPEDPRSIGFHLSSLYSPIGWLSWEEMARQWEAAQGSDELLRAFKNTKLGESWVDAGEAPDWERLQDRKEDYPAQVPMRGVFLTAGADVQQDRIEVDVWAWGRGLESWLVDHVVIDRPPHDPLAWKELTDVLTRTYEHESGAVLPIMRMAVDTGYQAAAVYTWARKAGAGLVSAIKGEEGFNKAAPVTGPTFVDVMQNGRRLKRGVRLWKIATATFKAETYRFIRQERPTDEELEEGAPLPAGWIHLPGWADAEWLRQFVSEQLVTIRNKRGFARLEWQKMRERNEALDCRVYARAAAWIIGADRWGDERWTELEAQLQGEAEKEATSKARKSDQREPSWIPRQKKGSWF